jgi:regulator of RNase E activity RraA
MSNAIDTFKVRSHATGFMRPEIRCIYPDLPAMVGYAVTGRIRSAAPAGGAYSRKPWWDFVQTIPEPRIVVFEDIDDPPGTGAFWGEVNANIHRALGCLGVITNGSVRDLVEVHDVPFHYFAKDLTVSRAYVHLVDFGTPVTVGGLRLSTGDLLHADRHGVLSVPTEIASQLPEAAEKIIKKERTIIDFCRSARFTTEGLSKIS